MKNRKRKLLARLVYQILKTGLRILENSARELENSVSSSAFIKYDEMKLAALAFLLSLTVNCMPKIELSALSFSIHNWHYTAVSNSVRSDIQYVKYGTWTKWKKFLFFIFSIIQRIICDVNKNESHAICWVNNDYWAHKTNLSYWSYKLHNSVMNNNWKRGS